MTQESESIVIVIIGISGTGKSHLLSRALTWNSNKAISRLIAVTTRPPRSNETNGLDYIFLSNTEFNEQLDDLCCVNDVYGNKYAYFRSSFSTNKACLCDIHYKKLSTLRDVVSTNLISIYIRPSNIEKVLQGIDQRSLNIAENTLRKSKIFKEYQELEIMSSHGDFDYVFTNDFTSKSELEFSMLISEILLKHLK